MKIGLRLRGGAQSPVGLAHVVLEAERSGLEFVCVADDARLPANGIGFASSVWPSLGAIAVATRRIQVQIDGLSITGPMHPAAIAHLSMSAAAMLAGRFTVGFSAGSSRAVTGRANPARPVRLRALAEGVDVFRRLSAGEHVDQQDTGVVINDLRFPGGSSAPMSVALTATEETEASLAAELACNLVVPPGADVTRVVAAYRAAGGQGEVSASLLLADPSDPKSIEVARAMLVDRAALDDAHEAGVAAPGPLSDDEVVARWIDATEHSRVFDAITLLNELGVLRVELMSPSRDAHFAIRQWRECNGVVDTSFATRGPAVGPVPPPRSVASPAPFDVEAARDASPPVARPVTESGESDRVRAPAPAADPAAGPLTGRPPIPASPSPVSEAPPNGDEEVVDLVEADSLSGAATPPNDGLRDALKVALADDEVSEATSPPPGAATEPRLADRLKS